MDDFALHADAASMDDPDLLKSALDGLKEILFHHNFYLTRLERVQVDGILDRQFVHIPSIMARL